MEMTREFCKGIRHLSGEALYRQYPDDFTDGAHARKFIRKAKEAHPDLWPDTIRKGICVFDLHYPHHVKRLWENICRFTADFEPDVFVFGGDNMNMDAVDHWKHEGGKRRQLEGKRLKKDYAGFNADVLGALALPDDCSRVFHLGNHEDWVNQYIDAHPEVEGFFEIESNLALEGWETYEYGQVSKVGKLHFTHGEYVNEHNAAKTVRTYHRNIVYGHGHTYQAFTEITPLDADSHSATQIPCACHLNPDYRRNKPNAWLNGFGVFYVLPGGNFNLFTVVSCDGSFVAPNGVLYK